MKRLVACAMSRGTTLVNVLYFGGVFYELGLFLLAFSKNYFVWGLYRKAVNSRSECNVTGCKQDMYI